MKSKLLAPLLSLSVVTALGIAWTVSASSAAPEQYALYKNDRWHFSLVVPAGMTVSTQDDPDNGQTIQFIDQASNYLFEIGATPYTQLDVALGEEGGPSNTSDQSTELGVVNVFHGDLYKVWFVHDGTFYVVTALARDEAWLINILQSWQFD
jgi:hypothetical protein